jgi:hypothetical protein
MTSISKNRLEFGSIDSKARGFGRGLLPEQVEIGVVEIHDFS